MRTSTIRTDLDNNIRILITEMRIIKKDQKSTLFTYKDIASFRLEAGKQLDPHSKED